MTNMRKIAAALAAVAAGAALMTVAGPAQATHGSCVDGRTNKSSWFISGGVPSDWTTALSNGALTWDNIQGDSHNFVRYQAGPADFNAYRGAIDGKYGVFAITPADHSAVKFDSGETWHLNVNVQPGSSALDLWSEAAHEFGHVISLAHSNDCYGVGTFGSTAPTMFGGYDYGLSWKRTLETYDVSHEKAIYP